MKLLPSAAIASLFLQLSSPCAAITIFGIDFGDFGYLESYFQSAVKVTGVAAEELSAGSSNDVCVAGDKICEASANVPKSANELGKPRYDPTCLFSHSQCICLFKSWIEIPDNE